MKVLTKTIEEKLAKHPFGSQDELEENAEVLLKVFNPYGRGTWLITEAEKQNDGNWLGFGWANLFGSWECGYIDIKELMDVRVNVFGCEMGLERDIYCNGYTVKECMAF